MQDHTTTADKRNVKQATRSSRTTAGGGASSPTLSLISLKSGASEAHTDEESASSRTTAGSVSDDARSSDQQYTYHYESAYAGGARYVRCAECGIECVPPIPSRITHREGCSEARQ